MSEQERYRAMIEAAVVDAGMTVQEWRADEDEADRPRAMLGRYIASDDDEEQGIFVDAEGEMTATVVGAAQYRNERVWFGFQEDGMDCAVEVREPMMFDPAT